MISSDALLRLAQFDTPTICNALELVDTHTRTKGFNRLPLIAPFTDRGPVIGYARTAVIRSSTPHPEGRAEQMRLRFGYYEYVENGPRPSIAVIQDADETERNLGAFWGEVQTHLHQALGCSGVITDGAVRDIPQMAEGFFVLAGSIMPSHVFADIVDYDCPVTVAGLQVAPGDIIHADCHGAVVIPRAAVGFIADASALLVRRESVILDACKRPGFSTADIRAAFKQMEDIS
ncbi:MAG: RraA family protein [Alphaproteobacteria bacterium]|nr:RraA family protein [Alphaproteobacteria bacterium]